MRLIDADALYKIAWPVKDHTGRIEECVQMRDLHKAPTIDAVPVVRCKECKHRPVGKSSGSAPDTRCPLWCGYCYNIGDEGDDFFCKYGERREEDGK